MANEMLLSCPFCGKDASSAGCITRSTSPDMRWEDGSECLESFYCNCMSCGANNASIGGGHQTRELALASWNHRTPSPAFVAMREALKACLPAIEWAHRGATLSDESPSSDWRWHRELELARAALALAEKEASK